MFESLGHLTYQPGNQIFKEGDKGDRAYLIERGSVDISTRKDRRFFRITTLGEGDLFGEMALIDDEPRTATATALEETCVISIDRDLVDAELANDNPIIKHLLRLMLRRFRDTHYKLIGKDLFSLETGEEESDQAFSETKENLIKHVRIASDINEALKQDQFRLYYQPIISIKDEQLVGFEALIRWMHPDDGLIPPMEFLNFAENTGQIIPIGTWVLEQACRDFHELNKSSGNSSKPAPLFISVNLSTRQLTKAGGAEHFANILRNAQVDPENIKLEVTETALIEEAEIAQHILSDLRDLGFHVSLDDFGTGYSSLSHLQKFPVDDIKIDVSFISRMLDDPNSMQIVRGSIDLARAMDLETVAEGVESKEVVKQLGYMKCTYAQGYYYAKPLPLPEAIEYLRQNY